MAKLHKGDQLSIFLYLSFNTVPPMQLMQVQSKSIPKNYRCQNSKEYKGKTNWAQSALPQ